MVSGYTAPEGGTTVATTTTPAPYVEQANTQAATDNAYYEADQYASGNAYSTGLQPSPERTIPPVQAWTPSLYGPGSAPIAPALNERSEITRPAMRDLWYDNNPPVGAYTNSYGDSPVAPVDPSARYNANPPQNAYTNSYEDSPPAPDVPTNPWTGPKPGSKVNNLPSAAPSFLPITPPTPRMEGENSYHAPQQTMNDNSPRKPTGVPMGTPVHRQNPSRTVWPPYN